MGLLSLTTLDSIATLLLRFRLPLQHAKQHIYNQHHIRTNRAQSTITQIPVRVSCGMKDNDRSLWIYLWMSSHETGTDKTIPCHGRCKCMAAYEKHSYYYYNYCDMVMVHHLVGIGVKLRKKKRYREKTIKRLITYSNGSTARN